MSGFIKKEVNGRMYALLPMAPLQALSFAPKVLAVMTKALGGAGLKDLNALKDLKEGAENPAGIETVLNIIGSVEPSQVTDLLNEVFQTEITNSEGQSLANKGAFDLHFTNHPGDLLMVGAWAIWENSKHFLFEKLGAFPSRTGQENKSPSPMGGKQKT